MEQNQNPQAPVPPKGEPASQNPPPPWAPQFVSNLPKESVMTKALEGAAVVAPPPPSGKGRSVIASMLKALAVFVGLVVVAVLVLGYLLVIRGSKVLGYSLPDMVWEKAIEGSGTTLAERSFKVTYEDVGTFTFIPSEFAKAMGETLPESEQQEIDKDYSFIMKDLRFAWGVNGFVNVADTEHPKADLHMEGSVSNNGKTYSASFDGKLVDVVGYIRYDYNNSIEELFKRVDEAIPDASDYANKWKNKWLKYNNVKYSDAAVPGVGFNPLRSARAESRDAKRISDVRQYASALDMYFSDNGGYPAGQGGKPVGLEGSAQEDLAGGYLYELPTAPTPADGRCTDDFNTYTYTAKGTPTTQQGVTVYPDYQLVFCLGSNTGGYEPGNLVLTPSGIKGYSDCQNDGCYKSLTDVPEDPLQTLLKDNRVFDIAGFKGIKKINGAYTFHYSLSLNEVKVKKILLDAVTLEMTEEDKADEDYQKFIGYYERWLDIFLEKWEVEQFEIWFGVADREVYQVLFKTNALSLTKTADLIYEELTRGDLKDYFMGATGAGGNNDGLGGGSPDAKRLSDIRQLAGALELYYDDNGGYPAGNGTPQGLVPAYVGEIPTAPPASGRCTDYYNNYWYVAQGQRYNGTTVDGEQVAVYPDFVYTFCLGSDTGGYKAGVLQLSPTGIINLADCPEPGKCYKEGAQDLPATSTPPQPASEEEIVEIFMDLFRRSSFGATVTWEVGASNFGKDKVIEEPKDAIDIQQEMQNMYNDYEEAPPPFST